jgi:serine/threonine protein kinase
MSKQSYVLGKRIARGGMAEIYLGKAIGEAAFERICAIKRVLPHYSQESDFVEMFRDEAHICKRLQHANIVQVYDFTEVEGSFALIMEHVDGGDLRTLLSACEKAKTRPSVAMCLYIATSSARGLHYAHTKTDNLTDEPLGIVHRDVSPQNILVSFEGEVKITDFGIASAENKLTETRPGIVKGKYSYMSPEQVNAKPLDGRSDVFSLAIVLWECLAMKRLFSGQTEVESIKRVQNCEIRFDLRTLNPDVDEELYQIVMRGLTGDRTKRYQSAAAFEKDLLRYLNSRYSEFNSSELGNFVKKILAKERSQSHSYIKETLALTADANRNKDRKELRSSFSQNHPHSILQPELELDTQHGKQGTDYKTGTNASLIPMDLGTRSRQTTQHHYEVGSYRTKRQVQPQFQKQTKPVSLRLPMQWLLASVFLFGLAAFWYREQIFDARYKVNLETFPESVRVSVNGKLYSRSYLSTPEAIKLPPGSHKLVFSRPGYASYTTRISGSPRQNIRLPKVYLKRLAYSKQVPVDLVSTTTPMQVIVNDGLFKGKTPLKMELEPGNRVTLNFRPISEGESAPFKQCALIFNIKLPVVSPKILIGRKKSGQYFCRAMR